METLRLRFPFSTALCNVSCDWKLSPFFHSIEPQLLGISIVSTRIRIHDGKDSCDSFYSCSQKRTHRMLAPQRLRRIVRGLKSRTQLYSLGLCADRQLRMSFPNRNCEGSMAFAGQIGVTRLTSVDRYISLKKADLGAILVSNPSSILCT